MTGEQRGREDARAKATGELQYVADLTLPGMAHVAVVRSLVPHARLSGIDTRAAAGADGVIGVFTADHMPKVTYGRSVRDVPLLAGEKVRFTGERVAAVVAVTRAAAEEAAALVDVTYDELPAVFTPAGALEPGAPAVHETPWAYPGAAVTQADGLNLQSVIRHGRLADAEAALAGSAHVIDQTYTTPSGHQGYLEPQACIADWREDGVRVWATTKSAYRLRAQLAQALNLDERSIEVQPMPLGGDFGGKGSPMDIPLCVELSRLTGRPVKLVLRYAEELTAANPRHSSRIRIRAGCDAGGKLTGVLVHAVLNGGAYGGFKPLATVGLHGIEDATLAYHVPAMAVESVIAYTNTVPRGHARSPGAPQAVFALESALDELAAVVGYDPAEFRRRNFVPQGQPAATGRVWAQARGRETLDAALWQAARSPAIAPPGWLRGTGIAVHARETSGLAPTSMKLVPLPGGRVRAEVPTAETGTGSHAVIRNLLAAGLGIDPAAVDVEQVGTSALPHDQGVGGSRVTVAVAEITARAAKAWHDRARPGDQVAMATGREPADTAVSSYCVQVAHVAVDPRTGEVKVLEIDSAVDTGEIIYPPGHQMQIDGGTVMGYGFACLEDLAEEDGQVGAANLGEFRLPTVRDLPELRTVLVRGGQGLTAANVKPVGELTNVPVAAAIANAVADAAGCRVRDLPVTAEKVFWLLRERQAGQNGAGSCASSSR